VICGAIDLPLNRQKLVICALVTRVAHPGSPGFFAKLIQQSVFITVQPFQLALKARVLGLESGSGAAGIEPGDELACAPEVDHQTQVSQQEHDAHHD